MANGDGAESANVTPLRGKTYRAKLVQFSASGLTFAIAGTLDGFIDFCIAESDGSCRTYSLDRDDARSIIAGLHTVVDDIDKNCLFDRDALLIRGATDAQR